MYNMFLNRLDNYSNAALTPEGLCNLIQLEYQPEIMGSCNTIEQYLTTHPFVKELPASVSEVVQLLFKKLEDELKHLFLKESGIVFPYIKKNYHGTEKVDNNTVDVKVVESVHDTHQTIIGLTQKIRQQLNNYVVKPAWSKEWKDCVNELFALENSIFQWIHVEQNLLYPKVTGLGNHYRAGHHHHLN